MPLPGFLASNPAVRATTMAVSLIWQSKIMTVAIFCEAIAAIAAVLNWVTDFWWLANAALTLATFGAVAVACRVAWDYHGRGLNAQQTHHVDGILTGASLNQTQSNEIAEAIQSSELTPRQKSRLASGTTSNRCCHYRRSSKGGRRRARLLAKTRPRPCGSDTQNGRPPIGRQVRVSATGERPLPTPTSV